MPKTVIRWQDMDHSDEPLLSLDVQRSQTKTSGPLPEFLARKTAEQAPRTAQWYEEALGQFWAFLEASGRVTCGDFTVATINDFRASLKKRRLSDNTVSNRLRAVRAFGKWMVEEGWISPNQIKGLKVPQPSQPHFDLISDEDRSALFALYNPDTFLGSRAIALYAVLSDTGVRREELVSIQLKDVDLEAGVLRVYSSKTSAWRHIPLTDETIYLIRNYQKWRELYFQKLSRRRKNKEDDGARKKVKRAVDHTLLFVTWKGTPMVPQELNNILARANRRSGGKIHPHLFRHDWLTRKALDGENPSIVRRWAGHKSFEMTDYYFGLADEMLGAIKPKSSVLSNIPLPGRRGRGRPPKASSA